VPLNLTQVFTSLGRAGRNAYLIDTAQAAQGTPFTQLSGEAWVNPAWVAQLAQSYDAMLRQGTTGMGVWTQAVGNILQGLVVAQDPAYGASLSSALFYLNQAMIAQAATVKECVIGSTVTPDSGNVGGGTVVVTLVRYDGLIFQNTVAEVSTLLITADSYTGSATAGSEPWQWNGAPNVSSYGTGTPVGTWDFDFPQGSGQSASGVAISASVDGSQTANMTTNGDFEDWSVALSGPSYWYLETGTWGTSIERSGTALGGTYSVQFNAGATLNALTQQFDSSDATGATAGTVATITAFTPYLVNLWTKATGVISGGVLTVSLVDSTGTVLQNQAGVNQSQTLALTGLSTSWVARSFAFQTPVVLPSNGIVRLKIKVTTALAGANLLVDDVCVCQPTSLYPGGPSIAVFSNPATPFEARPDPDGFTLTFTNDRGGATYGATFQCLISRLFQTPGLILPYDASPTISDSLITTP